MEVIAIVFGGLLMLGLAVGGLALFNNAVESTAKTLSQMKDDGVVRFSDLFYTKYGVNASFDLYIDEFQKKYGRPPRWPGEFKIPVQRRGDLSELNQVLKRRGIM